MKKDNKKIIREYAYWFLFGLTVLMEFTIIFVGVWLVNKIGDLDTQLESTLDCDLGNIEVLKENNTKIWRIDKSECSGKIEYTPLIFLLGDD